MALTALCYTDKMSTNSEHLPDNTCQPNTKLGVSEHHVKWALLLVGCIAASAAAQQSLSRSEHPHFRVDASTRATLLQHAKSIKPGDTLQTVLARLGQPSYDQVLMRKENREVIGRSLKYYVVRWDQSLVNEIHDEFVDVFLGPNNLVKSVSINVKGEN